MTTTPTPADEKVPGLRDQANRLLSDMAADARGDEPHLPLPPLPDGWADGFIDGYVEGALSAAKSAPPDAPSLLDEICDTFQIGAKARTRATIMANIGNVIRRSACLSAIENEFTEEVPGETEGEPSAKWSVLPWGADPAEYLKAFRTALAKSASQEAQVAVGDDGHPVRILSAHDAAGLLKRLVAPNGDDLAPPALMNALTDLASGRAIMLAATAPREVAAVEPANFATRTICTADVMASIAESPARQGGAVASVLAPYGVTGYLVESTKTLAPGAKLYTRAESPSLPVSAVLEAIEMETIAILSAKVTSEFKQGVLAGLEVLKNRLSDRLPPSERHLLLGGKS